MFYDFSVVFDFGFEYVCFDFFVWVECVHDVDVSCGWEEWCVVHFESFFSVGFHLLFIFFHHGLSSAHVFCHLWFFF